jgi:nucleoside-triphosphatase THEP1
MKHSVFADEETESLVLKVDDPFSIRDLIKESRTINHADYNIVVKWTLENVQLLRELGFNVPARKQEWPGPYQPFEHQLEMIAHRLRYRRCFDLSEQGSMKTSPCLWAADTLMNRQKANKVLILCPLSTIEGVWRDGIFQVLMHRTCAIVHGAREKRERALSVDVDFYILNHDAVRLLYLRKLLKKMKFDIIIIDEIGMFRDGSTEKFKALEKIVKAQTGVRIWGLTGTPCPNSPMDAWSQCRIINPDGVPEHGGTWKHMTMFKDGPFKWVARRGSKKLVFEAMQPAIRFLKKDCIDLPPVLPPINMRATLTPEQSKALLDMQNKQFAEIGDQHITAVHAADELAKIRQILLGCIKNTETGEYIDLGFEPRLKVLREAIDGSISKFLIIVPFKGVLNRIAEELAGDYKIGVLNGDVSPAKRNAVIRAFKAGKLDGLLCHPRVMAHGLNLTEADRIIFYGPIFSNDEFQQVLERNNRMGQKNTMTIIRISAHWIEDDIYHVVDQRGLDQGEILDLYRRAIDKR